MKELKSERVKTIAIIGASYLQRPLVERAKEMGLRTICTSLRTCKDTSRNAQPFREYASRSSCTTVCRQRLCRCAITEGMHLFDCRLKIVDFRMKSLAIIGASYLQRPLVERAKEMGLRTICFAWAEGAVCKDLCDVFYPISITEKEEILRICRDEHIDGICTIGSDVAAPTVAYVAEEMGLTGNSYEAAVRAHDKHLMHDALVAAGVDCPKSDGTALPVIVKPTDRSGSLGVQKVERKEDLAPAIAKAKALSMSGQVIVEEYIEGREISVEMISCRGVHYALQITDKVTTGAPHFVELEHHQPSDLPAAMWLRRQWRTWQKRWV